MSVPVIAIDGTAGSGKGLLSLRLAERLNYNLLDSGALYRLVALRIRQLRLDIDGPDLGEVGRIIESMQVHFVVRDNSVRTHLDGVDVDDQIRAEAVAEVASAVALVQEIRHLLLPKQREFAREPGLVADGRDMGSRVFPRAAMKFFLKADPKVATERRWRQLRGIGIDSDREALGRKIRDRDDRDRKRAASPLVPASDAVLIDTSGLSPDQVFDLACENLHRHSLL